MQKRFHFKLSIALREASSISQQKVAVVEHPQIMRMTMQGPQRLRQNRSSWKCQHHGANLAYIIAIRVGIAVQQPGNTKGEEQPVFVKKIQ